MRAQRPQPAPSRRAPDDREREKRYMDEVEVVVSPTGRQRLPSSSSISSASSSSSAPNARRRQPAEYSASKYKVYEQHRPPANYFDQVHIFNYSDHKHDIKEGDDC